MKVLLALAFLLWACADAHYDPETNWKDSNFLPGKLHRYAMTINMTSGIPGHTSQLSKWILSATVSIKPTTESEHLMKIENVLVSESLPAVETDEETLTMKPCPELEEDLKKPISFTLLKGKIQRYTLDKDETDKSKKIKRSILRHLEIQLKSPLDEEVSTFYESSSKKGLFPYAYNLTETTEREPVNYWYIVTVSPYPHFPYEENVRNVSKTSNYEPIGYPAIRDVHNFVHQGCPEVCRKNIDKRADKYGAGCPVGCEPHQTPLRKYSTSHYNYRLKENTMILESSWSEEKHIASMYDQDMVVTVRMEHTLLDVTNEMIPNPENPVEYTDLQVEPSPSNSINAGKETALYSDILPNIRGIKVAEIVNKTMTDIVIAVIKNDIDNWQSQAVGQKIIILQRLLSFLKVPHFHHLWCYISDIRDALSEFEKVKRQLFLHVLPLVGTDESVRFISKYLIEDEVVLAWEAKELLEALPENLLHPNMDVIKELRSILEYPLVKKNHVVHSAAYLCLSKVLRKMCVVPSLRKSSQETEETMLFRMSYEQALRESSSFFQEKQSLSDEEEEEESSVPWRRTPVLRTCDFEIKQYITDLTEKLFRTRKLQEKVVYIEALAHIGCENALPTLLPYMYGVAKDLVHYSPGDIDYMKTVALYSLHHIIPYYPNETLPFVTPVYFNLTEVPRVRTAAFSVIIRSQPPLGLLHHIALDSWKEPSREVASYVYSAVESFGNTTTPCMQLTADRIKLVISQFKRHDIGHHHAKHVVKTFFDKVRNFAVGLEFSSTPSNESIIPNTLYSSVMYNIDSLRDVLLQTAINVQGVTQEEILKIVDDLVLNFTLPTPPKPTGAEQIPKTEEERIFEELRIIPRLPKTLRLTIYKKFFYCSSLTYVDRDTLIHILQPLREYMTNIFTVRDGVVRGHLIHVLIPSSYHSIGYSSLVEFPIQFTMKHPILLGLKLEFSKDQKKDNYKVYVQPSVFYTTYETNEIVNMVDRRAVGVYHEQRYTATMPMNVYVVKNLEDNTWAISYEARTIPKMIFRYHSEAGTYAGIMRLEDLPSYNNKTIRHLPTFFVKKIKLGMNPLPRLEIVAHTEDYKTGIDGIPKHCSSFMSCITQKIDELQILAVKYLRNPGWRYRSLNATIIPAEGKPINKVTFKLSYNKTAVNTDVITKPLNEELSETSAKCNENGISKEEAKHLKALLVDLPHIAHQLNLSMTTSPGFIKYALNVEYNRTCGSMMHSAKALYSVSDAERSSNEEICMNHVQTFCRRPNELKYSTKPYEKQRSALYNELNFGTCKEFLNPDISTEGSMVRVPHKMLFDKNEFPSIRDNKWFLPETHDQCIQDIAEGKLLSDACIRAISEEAYYNKYSLNTEWKQTIPEYIKNLTVKAELGFRFLHHKSVDVNGINIKNPKNALNLTALYINKLTDTPVVSLFLSTPIEDIIYHKISPEYILPVSSIYSIRETYAKEHTNNSYPTTCALTEKWVNTFDSKTFQLPENHCTYVLSTECTVNKTFAIFARQLPSPNTKLITIVVGKQRIELMPATIAPGHDRQYIIKYNQRDITVSLSQPQELDREAGLYASVILVDSNVLLVIKAEKAGLEIQYDGINVKLVVNPIHKGQLCGLCSTFDGEITKEFLGVDQRLYLDDQDFALSSIIDSKKCRVDTTPKHPTLPPYSKGVDYPDNENDDEDRKDISSKLQIRNVFFKREGEICFSISPVPMCEDYSEPEEIEFRRVTFHCLPENDLMAARLVLESRRRVLVELKRKSVDYTETRPVAKVCA